MGFLEGYLPTRRRFVQEACTAGILAGTGGWLAGGAWAEVPRLSTGARRLYQRAIIIDAAGGPGSLEFNRPENAPLSPANLSNIRVSGVTSLTVTVGPVGNGADLLEDALAQIAWMERQIADNPDILVKIRHAADIRQAKKKGQLGLVYAFQDSSVLEGNMDRLREFHDLGLQSLQLTYNRRNLAGDGCLEPGNAGISLFGRDLIAAAESLGVLVDLSHAGQRTTAESIGACKKAPVISHTGCRAITDHPRNVANSELRALAEKGGVAGIYFMPYLRTAGQQNAEDVIRHIEHAINVCGEDHVGIGTDGYMSPAVLTPEYVEAHRQSNLQRKQLGLGAPGENDQAYLFVPQYNTPRRLELLASDLLKRGFSAARVEKILGANFMRIFEEVWR